MSCAWMKTNARILAIVCSLPAIARASPSVAFPFNSQVPTVARVNELYSFQFSESTFAPDPEELIYTLSNQPAWLTVDSATRTLSGTPGQGDAGSPNFLITAADNTGAAVMHCTLVVSSDPAPQLEGDISKQIAASANLSSSQPPIVSVLPLTPFHFNFQQNSFIDIVQRKLYYYATLADHTPLPSWLNFDAANLAFSGTAPQLNALPQTWNIDLIASDVVGFSGATASFTIAIGSEQLAFFPQEQEVNVTAGMQIDINNLQDQLYRNGVQVSTQQVTSAKASLPQWLTFNASTLEIQGTVPTGVTSQTLSVTVTDTQGGTATAVIDLVADDSSTSLFAGTIGTIIAYSGKALDYHFDSSLFTRPNLTLAVDVPVSGRWLSFNPETEDLQGTVPTSTGPSSVEATLIAKTSDTPAQNQVFTINIEPSSGSTATSASTSRNSPTSTSTQSPKTLPFSNRSHSHLSGGEIAAIVLLSCIGAGLVLLCFVIWCRRRREKGRKRPSPTPSKADISRPMLQLNGDVIRVTTELQTDVERAAGIGDSRSTESVSEPPPQLMLNLPSQSGPRRKSRWLKRKSHISQASSLGNGEDAIRRDSNIPELGHESAALHTPHDSFSVPTEMARVSRHLSEKSNKRGLKRLRQKHAPRRNEGLGIDLGMTGALPRHSSKRSTSHRRGGSSVGRSATMKSESMASVSTRGTSLLSTKASDFPQPPIKSMYSGMSIPTVSLPDAEKRRSIRMVERTDSQPDNRPIADKRQSFIRNRASFGLQSPLFSHGSRASSSNARHGGQRSANGSSTGSVQPTKRGKSMLTTYSESSSLEPRTHDSRRFSTRIRSTFAPNYPRPVTRSSLDADDDNDSSYYTTESSLSEHDLTAEMTLPRHQRTWVLPGEASPTPPPAPPASRQASSIMQRRAMTPSPGAGKSKWRSPTAVQVSSPLSSDRSSLAAAGKASQARRSRLSEPLSLVSTDSVNRARPKLLHTNSERPVSVEETQRLSSLRAETEGKEGAVAGGERREEAERSISGTGLLGVGGSGPAQERTGTGKSDGSGMVFL